MQRSADLPYESKLDQFDDFVAHAKLATLQLQPVAKAAGSAELELSQQASQRSGDAKPKHSMVLVRDLPYAAGVHRDRLLASLGAPFLWPLNFTLSKLLGVPSK